MKLLASKTDVLKLSYNEAKLIIASRIKLARLNAGMSQQEVADNLHCSQSTISRLEKGEIQPDFLQIRVMSGLFNVSILWLGGYPSFVVNSAQSSPF